MALNQIYVVDNLVGSLKLRGLTPTSQNTFTLDGFIQILSEEMLSNIVPLMDSISEEYFVTNGDIPFNPAIDTYPIPSRAVGNKLRDLVFVDANGSEINIPRLRPEDIKTRAQFIRYQPAPWGFYLKDDGCKLFLGQSIQNQPAYPTLRAKYFRRPNILTSQVNCGQISAMLGNTATVVNLPTTFTISQTYDIIKNDPSFVSRGDDLTISSIVGNDITFSSLPLNTAVGDWVCLANYSPIPQIPVEGHLLLAQYGVAKVLEALGDQPGLQAALVKADALKERFLQIITPRVEGSVIKLAGRSGIGDWMENQGWY